MAIRQQPEWLETEDEYEDGDGWHDPQRRLQHQVEIQSRQIDQVLSRHQVPAGVQGGSIRPHWVSFDLAGQLSEGWDRLRRMTSGLTGEIATALGVPEVRLERHGGTLRLAIKRVEPHPVDLLDLLDLLPEVKDRTLALGLDHQGQPVVLNLDQPDLHNVLVAGVSGAGKSSLMRSIAISLALTCRQSLAQLAVIGLGSAPSGITTRPNPLYPVNYLPHLLFPVATEVDEAIEALAYLAEEVAYRADHGISSPALIIMVDDADMLLRRVGGPVADQLASLLHAPAAAGVRVIIGASNPQLPDLARMLQHNVDLRLVGRMADERAAQAATGVERSYAQYLDGKGDFIAVSSAGIEPFQAAYIDDYDLHLTLTELHRASGPILLAQSPEERSSLPPSWSAAEARGFRYDAAAGRAEMEADDRTRMGTIEIAVERRQPADENLSWLDEAEIGRRPGGLSLPLAPVQADPDPAPPHGPNEGYRPSWQPVTDDEAAASEDAQARPDVGPNEAEVAGVGPAALASDEAQADDHYEMLPFDGEAEGARPTDPEPGQSPSADGPAPARAGEAAPRPIADSGADAPSRPGRGPALPSKERAQALWAVEPIYTDIDDDLWDAPDEDDDWRKRLH